MPLIRVGHSPDPDDAFMFYALATGKLNTSGLEVEHILKDIETLNRWAMEGRLEVTALSIHAYAYVSDTYALLPHGASMGSRYGPLVVAKEPIQLEELKTKRIAIPGTLTTAFLALQLLIGKIEYGQVPFDRILEAVSAGEYEAGLLIHEGQLTYRSYDLTKIVDLGEGWYERTGLPLPLGGNAIRKDLGPQLMKRISKLLKESIQYALDHREEALPYAMQFARGLDQASTDRFVSMYVNEYTLDWGEEGRRAVQLLLRKGVEHGILPKDASPEFVDA